jgi:hypothetical protein
MDLFQDKYKTPLLMSSLCFRHFIDGLLSFAFLIHTDDALHCAFSMTLPGRPEEFHLQSPTDPYVSLSTHTARVRHPLDTSRHQAYTAS